MEYLVIIDGQSPVGLGYAQRSDPVKMGEQQHVGLTCSEIDRDNPHYIFVRTVPIPPATSGQSLHIPHGNVLLIVEYDRDERRPPGFV